MKCPRCREGDLFETSTWSFQKPFDMPENCPNCGQSYFPEPGFYYGAMFIGYIFTGWIFLAIALVAMFGFGLSPWQSIGIVGVVALVFFVLFFRLARSVWAHIAIKYDPATIKSN